MIELLKKLEIELSEEFKNPPKIKHLRVQLINEIDRLCNPFLSKELDYQIKDFCSKNGLELDEILQKSRKREIVMARQALQYYLHKVCKFSLPAVGNVTGGKDHATVLWACKKVEFQWKFYEKYFKFYSE